MHISIIFAILCWVSFSPPTGLGLGSCAKQRNLVWLQGLVGRELVRVVSTYFIHILGKLGSLGRMFACE